MCGIFGVIIGPESRAQANDLTQLVDKLFLLSESRGKEASGCAVQIKKSIYILKRPISASVLIKSEEYLELQNKLCENQKEKSTTCETSPIIILGHTRLVTNGSQEQYSNNQPIIKNGIIGIHNGIVVNNEQLWENQPWLERELQVDTEVLLAMISWQIKNHGSIQRAAVNTFGLIRGMASIALLFDHGDELLLATNNGSLYLCQSMDQKAVIFASEKHILVQLASKNYAKDFVLPSQIIHVEANSGYIIDLQNQHFSKISLSSAPLSDPYRRPQEKKKRIIPIRPSEKGDRTEPAFPRINREDYNAIQREYSRFEREIGSLRRCVKCILPDTVPFIEFDEKGVCNYCRNYKNVVVHGEEKLKEMVEPFLRADREPDHIFMLSGGRDSCYGLHYVKTVLKMNPIAYTYDWGLITPLARRNISRMCGILGVEHILISADLQKKRMNIRRNVNAWLNNPELGLVPLFMAGDKQFFYYANVLGRRFGTKLVIQCRNPLEKTRFKSGFCGIEENTEHLYDISAWKKLKLFSYYMKQYIANPHLLNSSLLDSFTGFFSAYLLKHDYLFLYEYIHWDESKIISELREKYDWELSPDSGTTWRIGDGTSAFYNYIYYTVAGFSEHDTFLSNQIREGNLDRDDALDKASRQNQPRFDAIQWYCDTIGIDIVKTMTKINLIRKRYIISEKAKIFERK